MFTDLEKIVTIDIFSNISRRKDNETIKLGQFIDYNVKNIFFSETMQKMRQRD